MMTAPRILFATSEAFPLIKTGGLGDVAGALPLALKNLRCDVRIIMPAYRDALARASDVSAIQTFAVPEHDTHVTLLETTFPGSRVKIWLIDCPALFDRPGNPYTAADGQPWPDNAERFALFSRAVTALALGHTGLSWQPQVVHCNDWQTALVPALLSLAPRRPVTVFTIHNLAYQGLFDYHTFNHLQLPPQFWSLDGLEFHGQLSFIKGGLVYADHLTTVSPTYAREIQTPQFGYGLEGLLRHRNTHLSGILNGIDTKVWDPGHDPFLEKPFNSRSFSVKQHNKLVLQREFRLPANPDIPLIGMVSRLVEQKGIDLVIASLPQLMQLPFQCVILGSGQPVYEQAIKALAKRHPDRIAIRIGYDEALAHRVEGGADMFLMPSRFEPCGLNQLYSLRYGTVPIVHRTGGLADTVVHADPVHLAEGTATGIVFDTPDTAALGSALRLALNLYQDTRVWKRIARTGMRQSFSWRTSAEQYLDLYRALLVKTRSLQV